MSVGVEILFWLWRKDRELNVQRDGEIIDSLHRSVEGRREGGREGGREGEREGGREGGGGWEEKRMKGWHLS